MNATCTISPIAQKHQNQSKPTVVSNRPIHPNSNANQPRRMFMYMHENDRKVYDQLVNFVDDANTTYTVGDIREYILNAIRGEMHISLRARLEELFTHINRTAMNDMLDDYETHLIKVSPKVLPNETKEEYTTRTNLPECVVDAAFDRGDTEIF